uniref:FLYWCH-type domain-containing protein n=1 Tax=Scylla olivacea TaxID=85551 RepID=A0A0P4VR69_SCYOL
MELQPASPDVNNIEDHPVISYIHPSLHEESNLEPTTPIPDEILPKSDEEEFTIVVGGSKRRGDILVSCGKLYNKDGKVNKKQCWRCTVCNKSVNCLASITQHGETFKIGPHPHRCSLRDCALPAVNIKAYVQQQGKERPFASGSTLAKEAIHRHQTPAS